jgi:amino acid permease
MASRRIRKTATCARLFRFDDGLVLSSVLGVSFFSLEIYSDNGGGKKEIFTTLRCNPPRFIIMVSTVLHIPAVVLIASQLFAILRLFNFSNDSIKIGQKNKKQKNKKTIMSQCAPPCLILLYMWLQRLHINSTIRYNLDSLRSVTSACEIFNTSKPRS